MLLTLWALADPMPFAVTVVALIIWLWASTTLLFGVTFLRSLLLPGKECSLTLFLMSSLVSGGLKLS